MRAIEAQESRASEQRPVLVAWPKETEGSNPEFITRDETKQAGDDGEIYTCDLQSAYGHR